MSITEINQNEKNKRLEISCRIFFDDLEKTLQKKHQVKINIIKPADQQKVNQMVAGYLKDHLQVKANGRIVNLKFLGYEIEDDAAWCYLEAPHADPVKNLEVTNSILFGDHPEQQNMVHVTVGKNRKSTKLDNPTSRYLFSF